MLAPTLSPPAMISPLTVFQLPTDPTVTRLETFHANTITLTGTLQAVRESVESEFTDDSTRHRAAAGRLRSLRAP